MTRVRFMVTRTVRDENAAVLDTFVSGQEYDLPDVSAARWINRFDAVEVKDGKAAPAVSSTGCSIQRDANEAFVVIDRHGRTVGQTPLRGEAVVLAKFD